ncbi:ankyrin repeat domain containing protein [Stagonosporopsis vannaccii]|nr:ankyrin repeat domain containing protein [Stagonosporopsis vannaccii]
MEKWLVRLPDVNVPGEYFGNSLQAASFERHYSPVKQLLDRGADVNPPSSKLELSSDGLR